MSIIISLLLGIVFGFMFAALWRADKIQELEKANARLIEERNDAQNVFRTRQRMNWVN